MDIATLIIEALKFIFPAYCANAAPVLAGGGTPMDFGKNFLDGKRIFGSNKTFRGFFFGLAIGIFVGVVESLVFSYPIPFSVLFSVLSTTPTNMPIAKPKKKPLKVLFFPRIGFPSKKFFPKSIWRPPPAITGAAFAQ